MAFQLGVESGEVTEALKAYSGVDRRFELRGEADGVSVVDDYAHHPSEVAAVLRAARRCGERVLAVFQPHLYTRTQALYREFGEALSAADEVFLLPVYGAREDPLPGVDSSLIAAALRHLGHSAVHLLDAEVPPAEPVHARCRSGDTVLTLGAGDVTDVAGELVEALTRRALRV